ncbi:MAG TPA: hypothetical protein VGK25_14175 [Ignavibacteria bacterium]|jgi:hypothetical protein
MEIIFNSVRSLFYGLIVLIVNIPVFSSFDRVIAIIEKAARLIGIEV